MLAVLMLCTVCCSRSPRVKKNLLSARRLEPLEHAGYREWEQLTADEIHAATILGYTQANWEIEANQRHNRGLSWNMHKDWKDLTSEEQDAAKTLGWNRKTWGETQRQLFNALGITDKSGMARETPFAHLPAKSQTVYGGSAVHVAASMGHFLPVDKVQLNVLIRGDTAACVAARLGFVKVCRLECPVSEFVNSDTYHDRW